MNKAMQLHRIQKGQDFPMTVRRWKNDLVMLQRGFREKSSHRTKDGLLVKMVQRKLQEAILQHAGRFKESAAVRGKCLGCRAPGVTSATRVPLASACEWHEPGKLEIAATSNGLCCHGGGQGYRAADRATLPPPKVKRGAWQRQERERRGEGQG